MKKNGEKFSAITAYDYTFSHLIEAAAIEVALVGDSLGTISTANLGSLVENLHASLDGDSLVALKSLKKSHMTTLVGSGDKKIDLTLSFDASIIQSLCIELEVTTTDLCGGALGCKVLRSKSPIPTLLELRNRDTLLYIGPTVITGGSFKLINLTQVPFIFDRSFSNGIFTFLDENGYVYVISKSKSINFLSCITVRGIFEDPEALEGFSKCCGECDEDELCFTDDTEYQLQPYLIEVIRAEIIKEFVTKENIPEDKDNNADDN